MPRTNVYLSSTTSSRTPVKIGVRRLAIPFACAITPLSQTWFAVTWNQHASAHCTLMLLDIAPCQTGADVPAGCGHFPCHAMTGLHAHMVSYSLHKLAAGTCSSGHMQRSLYPTGYVHSALDTKALSMTKYVERYTVLHVVWVGCFKATGLPG